MGATAAFPCLAGHVTLLWRNWDVTSPLAKSLSARPCSSWTSAEGQCSFCDLSRLPGTTAVTVQSATLLALRTSRRLCGRSALAAEGTPSPDTHRLLRLQPLVLQPEPGDGGSRAPHSWLAQHGVYLPAKGDAEVSGETHVADGSVIVTDCATLASVGLC